MNKIYTILVTSLLLLIGCKRNMAPMPQENKQATQSEISYEEPERIYEEPTTTVNGVESKGVYFPITSLKEGLELAKATNKPLFIDCYTTWCGPCKVMKKYTFADPVLGSFMNQNFICVSMDMEEDEGVATAKRYGVQAYPTLLFLDKYGRVVNHQVGGISATELLQKARQAARN